MIERDLQESMARWAGVVLWWVAAGSLMWSLLVHPSLDSGAPPQESEASAGEALPAYNTALPCVSYAPFRREGHTPFNPHLRLTREQIVEDLSLIRPLSPCVRLYGVGHGQDQVPAVAADLGLKVVLGAWISRDEAASRQELDTALRLARDHTDVVRMLVVGNEVLLRQERSAEQLALLLDEARRSSPVPVAYADVWEFWLRHASRLLPAVDVAAIHILPYWEDDPVARADAVDHVLSIAEKTKAQLTPLPVWVAETGWPAFGRQRGPAVPGTREQALFMRELRARATEAELDYNVIEAFDQPWKRQLEGAMGGYWGLMKSDGTLRDAGPPAPLPGDVTTRWALWGLLAGALFGMLWVICGAWWGLAQHPMPFQALALPAAMGIIGSALAHHLSTLPGWSRTPLEGITALVMALVCAAGAASQALAPLGVARIQMAAKRWLLPSMVVLCLVLLLLVFDGRYRPIPWSLALALALGCVFNLQHSSLNEQRVQSLRGETTLLLILISLCAVALSWLEGLSNSQALWLSCACVTVAVCVAAHRGSQRHHE